MLDGFPLLSNQGNKNPQNYVFFLNRILQNIQIKTNPEIFAKKEKKGQNNLQFDGNNYHHHHADFLTSSVNKNTQKTTKKKTKSSNIIYLNCPVQIFILHAYTV